MSYTPDGAYIHDEGWPLRLAPISVETAVAMLYEAAQRGIVQVRRDGLPLIGNKEWVAVMQRGDQMIIVYKHDDYWYLYTGSKSDYDAYKERRKELFG